MKNIYADTRKLDAHACEAYALTEDILMENAAAALERTVKECLRGHGTRRAQGSEGKIDVLIVTGSGDNGGDGMALARRLHGQYNVAVYRARPPKSEACIRQARRACLCGVHFTDTLVPCSVLIDCLFGSGFRGTPDENSRALIDRMNACDCLRVACDIPSGTDGRGVIRAAAFRADITVCMGALKTALFSDNAKDFTGTVVTADLGISQNIFETAGAQTPELYMLEMTDMKLPLRKKQNTHKGTFGHCAVVSGQKEGAAVIAGLAAFSFGAGQVTLVETGGPLAHCPYELTHSDDFPQHTSAVAAGMGMGAPCARILEYITGHPELPCVLDADILRRPEIKTILEHRGSVVLTPHPGEFRDLLAACGLGEYSTSEIAERRIELLREFCAAYPRTVTVLKGANTIIGSDTGLYVNTLGKSSLSKGGSGDVLAGLVCALLAQGYAPLDPAVTGPLAHAAAARRTDCDYGLTPQTLIESVKRLGTRPD